MDNKMERILKICGAVLLVIVLVWLVVSNRSVPQNNAIPGEVVPTGTISASVDVPTSTPTSTSAIILNRKPIPHKPASVQGTNTAQGDYGETANTYDGHRFQFSSNCNQVSPNSMVIKKGLKIMLDNREDKAHTFTFIGQKYQVGPYGYVIITAQPSGHYPIFCDGAQRVFIDIAP